MIKRFKDGESFIMVFGSNEAGIHGKGAALHAHKHLGAVMGRGVGLQGISWALPTKDTMMNVLCLEKIRDYFSLLIEDAKKNPNMIFQLSRIGCGFAGFRDEQMIEMVQSFKQLPKNIVLPGVWRKRLDPTLAILAVVGSRCYKNKDFVFEKIEQRIEALKNQGASTVLMCSGGAQGVDHLAEAFAQRADMKMTVIEANWDKFGPKAGPMRNATLAWYASDVLAIRFPKSPGTENMVNTSRKELLQVQEFVVGQSSIAGF